MAARITRTLYSFEISADILGTTIDKRQTPPPQIGLRTILFGITFVCAALAISFNANQAVRLAAIYGAVASFVVLFLLFFLAVYMIMRHNRRRGENQPKD